MSKNTGLLAIVALPALPALVQARGVTPYLPLNLNPQVERQIEQVLILGGRPALRRPIPAAQVLDALPQACKIDVALCERVRRYLNRYMHDSGLAFASVEASASTGSGAHNVIPNAHGQSFDSHYQVALGGYLQLGDYALVNLGGVAYEGRAPVATGSFLSLGFDFAQLDIGYRDHWWSPTVGGSMLISTEAPTMPGITLSNYRPLTRLGIEYEVFLSRMSHSTQIQTVPDGALTSGYPRMAGIHVGIEPVSGFALGANRVLIYGGGAAGGQSFSDILDAFFDPSRAQSTGFGSHRAVIGKQEASVVSQMIFPGRHPFSAYVEYAANDTSTGSNFLFGKPDLTFGIHLPRIGTFDITIESSVWEPTWYVHGFSPVQTGYGDGITNDKLSIGNWFGDQRQFGDAVGGQSQLLRVGWEPHWGGRLEAELRMLTNDSFYGAVPYKREYMGSLSYAYPWRGYAIGAQIDAGRDVFGAGYARLSGFLRLGDALSHGGADTTLPEQESSASPKDSTEVFVDVGANVNTIREDILGDGKGFHPPTQYGPHLGVGARRAITAHQDLGVRLDADDIDGHLLLGVRAIDYRYRFDGPLALDAFGGAARYSAGTPAIGWYVGLGPEWRNVLPGWDLSATARYGWKLARLRVLPGEPSPGGLHPDSFYDVYSLALSLSHKF